MKRLLPLLLLASCSAQTIAEPAPLQPLPTTGRATGTTVPFLPIDEREQLFIDNLAINYPGAFPFGREEMISMGWEFCESLSKGSTHREIRHYIASVWDTEQKETVSRAVLTNAVLDLCPHHLGRP